MFLFGRTKQHEGSVKATVKEVEEFKVLNVEHIASRVLQTYILRQKLLRNPVWSSLTH